MVISTPDGPADAAAALAPAVSHLMGRSEKGLAGGAALTAQTSRAIPIFAVRLDQARDANFVSYAEQRGWRYLIIGNGPSAVADVREKAGRSAFAQLTRGALADRLAQVVQRAEKEYGTSAERFEPRIIDIPSLGVTAFWLHGVREVFYPVHEGAARRPFTASESTEFVGNVVESAREMLARQARGPDPVGR